MEETVIEIHRCIEKFTAVLLTIATKWKQQ